MTNNYLSYSGRHAYIVCPKKYWFRYIKKLVVKSNPRSAIFGLAIGKIFEWFYMNQLWVSKDTEKVVLDCIDEGINSACLDKKFDPKEDPKFLGTVKEDLEAFIPPSLETIRKHRLLTQNSVSELKLNVLYESPKHGMNIMLGGRADFVHYKNENQIWILDGKASKYREKYVDSAQLVWYAVQHYIKFHHLPTRLGFWFFRFPDDPIQWIQFDESTVRKNLDKTFEVMGKINLKMWNPTPTVNCYLCDYRGSCKEGTKFVETERLKNVVDDSVFDLERI